MVEDNTLKKDTNDRKYEQDVDTGYSWIVLLGSFVMYMLAIGSMTCFGVLYTEMLDHFSAGSGNTALISSIAWLLLQGLAPIANVLTRKFSFRLVTFFGGMMVGCGYSVSGFVKQMEHMYLTFTIVGVGYGLTYTSSATIINYYFKKRRTLANGIVVSSGGIAVLVFPFLYRFLIDKYGLSQALMLIGAIHLNICVAGCVFRQPKSLLIQQKVSSSDSNAHPKRSGKETAKKMYHSMIYQRCSLLKNRRFTLLVIALTICSIGHVNNYILIPAQIKSLGHSNTHVTIGVSITGGAELIGRIFIGWFADLNIMRKIHIFAVCSFIGGVFALIAPLFDSFAFMAVYAGVAGAFPASFLALLPVLVIERVGIDNFQTAFAFISVSRALVSMISQPISGWLADYYGDWHTSFVFIGISLMCACVLATLENVIIRFGVTKDYSIENNTAKTLENDENDIVSLEIYVKSNESDTPNVVLKEKMTCK